MDSDFTQRNGVAVVRLPTIRKRLHLAGAAVLLAVAIVPVVASPANAEVPNHIRVQEAMAAW